MGDVSENARLAGELQTTQFALDDLAHDVGAGRAQPEHLEAVAERLEQMAQVLRLRAGNHVMHKALGS